MIKAGVSLTDFKEFDGIGVDERNRMRFMFAQIPSDFFVPTARPIGYDFCYIYPIMHFAQ